MSTTQTSEYVNVLRERFQYWPEGVPELATHSDVDHLRRDYELDPGPRHWFDIDTSRFFGSRNRHLHRPGLLIETQMNAPDGVGRYRVTAWVMYRTAPDHRGAPTLQPCGLGDPFHTLSEARRFVEQVSSAWNEARPAIESTEA
jgi:hypothetical protein